MSPERTTTASPHELSAHPCGCSDTEAESWPLECLERPRFSSGQLLTDQDLTALVEWSDKKAGLARHRHGWGVVCGLGVVASGQDGHVALSPGYAVDGCGNDIVVSAETIVRLDNCCTPEPNLCAGVVTPPADVEPADFAGIKIENVRIIDLVLRYAEVGASPRATLGGATAARTGGCEYARTKETFRVECRIGTAEADPVRIHAEKWEEAYRKCLNVVKKYREENGAATGGDVHRWLIRWIDRNPLHQFCFLKDWILETAPENWDEKLSVQALFWIVQDCRNSFLLSGCGDCPSGGGVPIARVWVRSSKAGGAKSKVQILAVDAHPPYRRLIRQDYWLAPMGSVNVGRVIWRRAEDAQGTLNGLGLKLGNSTVFAIPGTVKALQTELEDGRLIIPSDTVSKLQIFDGGALGFRVVGIR